MDTKQTMSTFVCRNNEKITCPICGHIGLSRQVRDTRGYPSREICHCCGFEIGYEDAGRTHQELRDDWIRGGMVGFYPPDKSKEDWDPIQQLKAAGLWSSLLSLK
jgi:hypothetical protein